MTKQEFWKLSKAKCIYDEQGKIKYFLNFCHDITLLKHSQENLKFTSEISKILNSSLDDQRVMVEVVERFQKNLAEDGLIEIFWEDEEEKRERWFFHPEKEVKWPVPDHFQMSSLIGEPVIFNYPLENVKKVHPSHLPQIKEIMEYWQAKSLLIVPIQIRQQMIGCLVLVLKNSERNYNEVDLNMVQDLTRSIGIFVENNRLFHQAQSAIVYRDQFLSIASHELKNPMTSLKLYLQMTRRLLGSGAENLSGAVVETVIMDKLDRNLKICLHQVDQLTKLINDLLDVSKIQSGKMGYEFQEMDLVELTKDLVQLNMEALENSGHAVTLNIPEKVIGLWDKSRLEQMILNFLSNVMKYAPGSPLHIHLQERSDTILFSFQDFGPGIEKEKQKKIFERFERGPLGDNRPGLGLGLFIVNEIVKAHQGQIILESQVGKGSKFIIELPRRPEKIF